MKRLLTTTAIVLAMGTAAIAQDDAAAVFTYEMQAGTDYFASDIIGMRIYATETEMEDGATITAGAEQEWDDIGEINDLIVTEEGEIAAVILGVGGFLGIGEKDVAVDISQIAFVTEQDNPDNVFLVVRTTQADLENATAFERQARDDMAMATEENADAAPAENADAMTEENADTATAENTDTITEENADTTMEDADTTMTAADREMFVAPEVARDGYARAEPVDLTAETLTGARVYDVNDDDIGEVSDLVLADDGSTIENVVIDVGGFLGIGEKRVAVTFDELSILRSSDGGSIRVYIDATQEALEAQPAYDG